jgi:hypothetical protein
MTNILANSPVSPQAAHAAWPVQLGLVMLLMIGSTVSLIIGLPLPDVVGAEAP